MQREYNYINSCNVGSFENGTFELHFKNTYKGKQLFRFINSKTYCDPDEKSKILYDDLYTFYNGKITPNKFQIISKKVVKRTKDENSWYELVIEIKENSRIIAQIGLGADYIGPSVYWGFNAGLCNDEIKSFLLKTRVFGGHIVWPRWIGIMNSNGSFDFVKDFQTMNLSCGGEKGFYDRIDLTLFDLKEWYLGQNNFLNDVYNKNRFWFDLFVDFKGFIDFFNLDAFVEPQTDDIKNLCSYYNKDKFITLNATTAYPSTIPTNKVSFQKFSDGLTTLIATRNNKMIPS